MIARRWSGTRCVLLALVLGSVLVLGAEAKRRRRLDSVVASEDFEFDEDPGEDRDEDDDDESDEDTFSSYLDTDADSQQDLVVAKNRDDGAAVDELCRALKCPEGMVCLVQNRNAAMCIKKTQQEDEETKNKRKNKKTSKFGSDKKDDSWEIGDDESSSSEEDDEATNKYNEENETPPAKPAKAAALTCRACPVAKPSFVCGSDNQTFSSPCRLHFHNCVHGSVVKIACKGFCPCKSDMSPEERKQMQVNQRQTDFVTKYKMTVTKLKAAAAFAATKVNQSAANPTLAEDKQRQRGHNDIIKEKLPANRIKDCQNIDTASVGLNLMNWFSDVMSESRKTNKKLKDQHRIQFPFSCPVEVRWMFTHLDAKSGHRPVHGGHRAPPSPGGRLQISEVSQQVTREKCASQFLEACDVTRDSHLSATEWCKCFSKSVKPCSTARNKMVSQGISQDAVPECDANGFYLATQCQRSVGVCWCVDRNGIEYANTRTRGQPKCDKIKQGQADVIDSDDDTDDESDDDDDVIEGSADKPLDI